MRWFADEEVLLSKLPTFQDSRCMAFFSLFRGHDILIPATSCFSFGDFHFFVSSTKHVVTRLVPNVVFSLDPLHSNTGILFKHGGHERFPFQAICLLFHHILTYPSSNNVSYSPGELRAYRRERNTSSRDYVSMGAECVVFIS